MIFSAQEVKKIEADAFARGESAELLMEQAGLQVAEAVEQFFPQPGNAVVYFGKGHNGGDALVAARHLAEKGWRIEPHAAFPSGNCAELTQKKLREFQLVPLNTTGRSEEKLRPLVILDGLLGISANGGLRDPIRAATREINRIRRESYAHVFAIDLPTGLDGDTGAADPDCVVADFTLTIGFAKTGLVADGAANFTGRLAVLPLPELRTEKISEGDTATPQNLAPFLPRRNSDSHKSNYGRVGIVAGSVGTTGAALMSSEAALRAGSGLITLFVTRDIYPIVAAASTPEIMVRPVDSFDEIPLEKLDVLAVGPGLGRARNAEILRLVERAPQPMVVDADALNAVSTNIELLKNCAGPRLLTPHPGEMARLFSTAGKSRVEIVKAFTEKFPVTLLLKGARTLVGEKNRPLSYNTTGNPGMASGGMGDVLTGICTALLGQGLSPFDAARLGAWLHGRAAEIAIFNGGRSEESLSATDLFGTLGTAFKQLRARCF
jgi:NAD(P)H-hydrate epimerase